MRNINKFIILFIIILDLLYLGQWSYKKYNDYSTISFLNDDKNNNIIVDSTKSSFLPYGTVINDHSINVINGNILNISQTNNKYKIINIVPYINIDLLNTELNGIVNINNVLSKQEMIYILISVGNLLKKDIKELIKIQNDKGIYITNASKKYINEKYSINDIRCGFLLILDYENRIRYAGQKVSNDVLLNILSNELLKDKQTK